MDDAVFGLATGAAEARAIFERLCRAGFGARDISVVYSLRPGGHDVVQARHLAAPADAGQGAQTASALGGVAGWLVGLGTLSMPGFGPLAAAGPIRAALSGAAAIDTVCGVADALIALGVPEDEARRFEEALHVGHILISVRTAEADDRTQAEAIFERAGATDEREAARRTPGA